LREWLDETIAQPRFNTMLSGIFALIALLLAAIGAYGVLSDAVTQRTREIGVRIAVGAERREIIALVLRGGLSSALAGIAVGLGGAFVLSGALRAVLFDVSGRDPATYVVVSAVLAVVATVACIVPAARAARIDPVVALRAE
jgi:ABC-type antimicrobial peptide transport system permease subunit